MGGAGVNTFIGCETQLYTPFSVAARRHGQFTAGRWDENVYVPRSRFTIDAGAVRRNAARLADVLGGTELWAVVKADGYGHGALDVSRAALAGGARALCVATVAEGATLRAALPDPRIVVLGPTADHEVGGAREARLELVVGGAGPRPDGIPLHLKLDTGMGRWGLSELAADGAADVVGVMSHFASADCDDAFTREQTRRFLEAAEPFRGRAALHLANSAGALRFPESRLDAARCGIALYGVSPFGTDPRDDGLEPALRWESELALVRRLEPGESTGYGRRFVAGEPAWIGIVPVGYADGFRRDLTGTLVLVAGQRCPVVGTVSMDALAVRLEGAREPGTPVTLIGDDILVERHADVAGTIGYELVCGLRMEPDRAERVVVGA
jgi:alanine racemase